MNKELLEKIKEYNQRRKVVLYLHEMRYPVELQKSFQDVKQYLLKVNATTNEEIGTIARESFGDEI